LKRRASISLRLTFWFSVTFLLGFLIFGTIMFLELSYSLSAGRDKTLLNRAGRAMSLLKSCQLENSQWCATKFADFAAATPEGNLILIFNSQGNRIYPVAPESVLAFPWPRRFAAGDREFSKVWYSGALYRVLSEPTRIGSEQVWIFVGGQLKDNRVMLSHFRIGLLWATPALLVFSALFGYFMSRRALGPVARLTASARSISIGNLSRRLPIVHTGDELQALAETCNEMLGRLEVAVNQITRFTADASHELRSPISFIYTLSECALRNPSLDAESAESFNEIVRECSEATQLLDDMLALARVDAGHADATFERLNLVDVFFEACTKARPFAEVKRHSMTIHVNKEEPVWIMGDAPSLQRLFWILLDNAIKYTPAYGEIDVSLETVGEEAHISVRDTGIGIPDTALSDIFRRFYRADKARTLTEGTGLGLAIAKWISDIHRGVLSVDSVEDSGTTFQISFRLAA
jgi:signal transduction histidine kinase